jgi:putative DNA primase/helicase
VSATILRADDVHAAIGKSWPAILASLGVPEEALHGKKGKPCPACGGTDRFCFDNRTGRGDFICRGCGAGDGFDLLMRVYGWNFSEARQRVIEAAGLATNVSSKPAPAYVAPRSTAVSEPLDWSTRAESIWRKTQSLAGTLGEVYLHHRGCVLPPRDSHLRFLSGDDHYPPSLCAAVTDIRTAQPISLHFTRLAIDGRGKAGTDKDKLLLAGHRKKGGAIRLWPDDAVTYGLVLAEGIETSLAVAHAYTPVWSAIDASNLAAFPVLAGVESLLIFADHDDAGLRAARECGRRWRDAGREVSVRASRIAGNDAADEVAA